MTPEVTKPTFFSFLKFKFSKRVAYSKFDFGEDFHWGVSTAAYQIEGGIDLDGKGPSVWDKFVRNSNKIKDGSNANMTCNHCELFSLDVDLIRDLHIRIQKDWYIYC